MKVSIVGAGPAGLYLAVLLKKADAGNEITVVERNAPDATFGWGVVFSEETLGALRDADYKTYVEITDSFARWSTVDIWYRGARIRSGGNRFSAIKRTHLLDILQRRCTELGVDLRFGTEVTEPDTGADLLVAADGANSLLRRADADSFGTTVSPQGCKYVWFGTDLVFDAFTFIFTETEHGLFQVHAYPFDERTSTFIVECPEPTWRRAGLDTMTERESIAFCERLFAEHLGRHRLLSNRSLWLSFPLVRNTNWHKGNLVLIGDAAHTAHFSIGSGTKLAMEDAIALANAFIRHPDDREAALVDYELERMPVVERFQQAAGDSAAYFGRVGGYTRLEPIQFAANLLTRSGRISHANLTQRDPDFARVLDAWFAGAATPGAIAPPPAFVPLEIGRTRTRNRVVRLASTVDDLVPEAASGAGLVLTGLVAVTPDGRVSPDEPTIDAPWAPVVDKVHAAGALAGLRLGHAGRRGATRPRAAGLDVPLAAGGWPLLAASALRYGPFGPVPRAMDAADLDRVRAAFAEAAERAAAAGFDALELDMADGYLLAGFLSPLTNRRTDEWGGSPGNRARYPLSVLDAVRAVWPDDRLLAVRLTVTDWARGGLTVADGVELARQVAGHGAQLVHVRAGQTVLGGRPEYRRGFLTTLSDRVRNEAGVPTLVAGHLTTLDEVDTIVAAGRADLCVLDLPSTELERTVLSP
ncbi:MAG TPA: FAD-dependent monooxygenase [Actinophytocola sp.]|uniref:oxidoreductase n=1 Tax=Actinophytocola sp. TaxID=1872138 RepID=UPI002DB741AE|nr:FAD-dependent monooxygenase [Actinophytocola sp.]HEU5470392.1 FAD-dependent monooxygenase [Actinophytocola sp.]